MEKFIALREKAANGTPEDERAFRQHERICINKLQYLITMKTGKYKSFSNYEDINQEGYEALVKAMKNYNPKLGNFFWWCHRYIDTRIARSANMHTAIRYPMKVAKTIVPHKENNMPLMIEDKRCPDKEFEENQKYKSIQRGFSKLNEEQKEIISLVFGFDNEGSISINKICKRKNITRLHCLKIIKSAISVMRDNFNK